MSAAQLNKLNDLNKTPENQLKRRHDVRNDEIIERYGIVREYGNKSEY